MTPFPNGARLALRAFAPALALAAAGLTVACADGPTAPGSRPALATAPAGTTTSTSGSPVAVNALLWKSAVTQATASAAIGAAGGTLTLPGGPTLVVPKGAVASTLTFSITRLPGRIVAYDFQPHGTTFATPVTVKHPTVGTNIAAVGSAAALQGAYFASAGDLYQADGYAKVAEFSPSTTVTADKSSVSFTVKHFSGYLMSTGRRGN